MTKYCGIDASTQSLAWGIIDDESHLLSYGEVLMTEKDFYKRLAQIREFLQTDFFQGVFDEPDYICFERAIIGPNKEVALKLSAMFGAMQSVLVRSRGRLVEAPPMAWQEAIGNPVLRGRARQEFFLLHPEWKTKSQMAKGIRDYRKSLTQTIVLETFGEFIKSDNITDAIGLAIFAKMVLKGKS
jgi:Holliday junction resolvasome RuvABC endonuclease subunit